MEHLQRVLLPVVRFLALMVPTSNTNTKESSSLQPVSMLMDHCFLSHTPSSAPKTTTIGYGFYNFSVVLSNQMHLTFSSNKTASFFSPIARRDSSRVLHACFLIVLMAIA